jgi:hypothetical protein
MVLLFEGRFDGNLEGCGDVIEKTTQKTNVCNVNQYAKSEGKDLYDD